MKRECFIKQTKYLITLVLPMQVNSEKNTMSTSQSKDIECQREVHSEGEMLSDEENKDTDLLSTVSRLKRVSIRKFKEWKS